MFDFEKSQHKLFIRERKWWSFVFFRHQYFCEKGKFVTNVSRKKTFSGVYTNFNSFVPETYKTSSIESLMFWCFNLCSHFVKFHHEINILKSILYKDSYPHDFVDKWKKNLDRVLMQSCFKYSASKVLDDSTTIFG